jgi:hypothetical protein
MVPDLCPTNVKILTHLISRYHLPIKNTDYDRIGTTALGVEHGATSS